jgi:hypothetical protein
VPVSGVRSFVCVSVALLLKVVMLPGAGAPRNTEVYIKNCGTASTENFTLAHSYAHTLCFYVIHRLAKRMPTARHAKLRLVN